MHRVILEVQNTVQVGPGMTCKYHMLYGSIHMTKMVLVVYCCYSEIVKIYILSLC